MSDVLALPRPGTLVCDTATSGAPGFTRVKSSDGPGGAAAVPRVMPCAVGPEANRAGSRRPPRLCPRSRRPALPSGGRKDDADNECRPGLRAGEGSPRPSLPAAPTRLQPRGHSPAPHGLPAKPI